ncbi:MAG TPA: CPBP family intramembrane glutamic endopeptidase [Candidatus Saccharimonadales bacterium]|nr:CPBP family intramembrane glutamic endopeptidase [Candidatus Saccharimonadales bacterium]
MKRTNNGNGTTLVEAVLLIFVIILSKYIKTPLFNQNNIWISIALGLLIGFMLFLFVAFAHRKTLRANVHRNLSEFHYPHKDSKKIDKLILKPIIIAVSEELFFRGLIYSLAGFWIGNILFAVLHALVFTDKFLTMLHTFVFGIVFTLLYLVTGSLLAPIVCHWFFTFLRIYYFPSRVQES